MNKIIEFLKNIPSTIQLVLVGVVVFLITSTVMNIGKKDEITTYIDNYKKYQKESQTALHLVDSLTKSNHQKDSLVVGYLTQANVARSTSDELKKKLPSTVVLSGLHIQIDSLKRLVTDSVQMARVVIPAQDTLIKKQDSTITIQGTIIEANKVEAVSLRGANRVLSDKNGVLKFSVDTLTRVIRNMPVPPKNPNKIFFGLIPKPNRVQSAIAGFVSGVVLYAYVTR